MTGESLMSIDEVADIVGLSPHSVRRAIRDGQLQAIRLRRSLRVHPDDLARWLDDGRLRASGTLADLAMPMPEPRPSRPPSGGFLNEVKKGRRAA